jgi:hypothetical protein
VEDLKRSCLTWLASGQRNGTQYSKSDVRDYNPKALNLKYSLTCMKIKAPFFKDVESSKTIEDLSLTTSLGRVRGPEN